VIRTCDAGPLWLAGLELHARFLLATSGDRAQRESASFREAGQLAGHRHGGDLMATPSC